MPPTPPQPGRLVLDPPPEVPDQETPSGALATALPVVGSIGSVALLATSGGEARTRALVAAGLFLLATIGFVVLQLDRQRQQRHRRTAQARGDYLLRLAGARAQARAAARAQRARLQHHLPPPAALPVLAGAPRHGPDPLPPPVGQHASAPLGVRWGLAAQPLTLELVEPQDVPPRADPVALDALRRFVAVHRVHPDLPAALDLRACPEVVVTGPPASRRALARSLVVSAATAHPPATLHVACLAAPATLSHWEWLKWLPHAHGGGTGDACGPPRLVGPDPLRLARALPTGTAPTDAPPHLLLVVDAPTTRDRVSPLLAAWAGGCTVVRLGDGESDAPEPYAEGRRAPHLRLALRPAPTDGVTVPVVVHRSGADPLEARADQCDEATAEALARRLASHVDPARPGTERGGAPVRAGDLPDGVLEVDAEAPWPTPTGSGRLRVVLGRGESGPLHLDLKEAAEDGMGPHGLVVGATGSGKSELLRTIVLGLAATHPPEELNAVLVDFKGGATFAGLGGLPHVSALITNLAAELALLDRMEDALAGEVVRRQELLRAAGDLASARDHAAARRAGAPLDPLPSLLVVVDEFTELLAVRPDLLDLFVTLGRLGRSLGIHLLLATQRLEEGRLRGLESHLSYRVALRTSSTAESRAVIGSPDAAALPTVPGLGYLRAGPDQPVAFRAGFVSGPAPGRDSAHADPAAAAPPPGLRARTLVRFTAAPVPEATTSPGRHAARRTVEAATAGSGAPSETRSATGSSPGPPPTHGGRSLLDATVEALAARARAAGHRPAHRVWLPPLQRPAALGELLPDLAVHLVPPRHPVDPDRPVPPDHAGSTQALFSPSWRGRPGLALPVGVVDRPREQRREVLALDLSGAAGHVGVVGGPRSGRSTTLRTLVCALTLTRTPSEAQVLLADLAGGGLAGLEALPHVAGTATRSEPDALRRLVAQVRTLVDGRAVDARAPRDRAAAGPPAGWADGWGEVLVVVDGWSTLRAEHDDLEHELVALAARSLAVDVHVVLATHRWADLRPALRDLLGSRLELRLGDPLDSEVDRRAAAQVPRGRPGRGLTTAGHHLLTALPALARDQGTADLVSRVAAGWRGPEPPRLRPLPALVGLDVLRADHAPRAGTLVLAQAEADPAPVTFDPDADVHLAVLGDRGSGRTSALRTTLRELVRVRSPEQAQVLLVDPRRTLAGEVPAPYLLDDLATADGAAAAVQALAARLHRRLPDASTPSERLRDRSWWSGPDVFVVVDDHDLLLGPGGSPLAPLQPLLARGSDVGLHLLLARRAAGAAATLADPLLAALRDLGAPGLVLSARPEDGPLWGLRTEPAIPGRGRLVGRDGQPRVVQAAWTAPAGT